MLGYNIWRILIRVENNLMKTLPIVVYTSPIWKGIFLINFVKVLCSIIILHF